MSIAGSHAHILFGYLYEHIHLLNPFPCLFIFIEEPIPNLNLIITLTYTQKSGPTKMSPLWLVLIFGWSPHSDLKVNGSVKYSFTSTHIHTQILIWADCTLLWLADYSHSLSVSVTLCLSDLPPCCHKGGWRGGVEACVEPASGQRSTTD